MANTRKCLHIGAYTDEYTESRSSKELNNSTINYAADHCSMQFVATI